LLTTFFRHACSVCLRRRIKKRHNVSEISNPNKLVICVLACHIARYIIFVTILIV
jgi:hypothetical protein